jgi:hypothetical protein
VRYEFIAIVWVNHHHLLRLTDYRSPSLIWINFAHLFMVSLVPFSTSRVARTRLGSHADSKAPAFFLPGWFAVCRSSLLVRQLRHTHPLVPWSGTGSVWGRPEHQQSCPGLQDMGQLHCEQNAFMVGAF